MYGPSAEMAYAVRFRYPAPVEHAAEDAEPAPEVQERYRISGARALRPTWIGDNGVRTYIEWPADRPLPAVYTIDETGREALVNGNMRDGLYVIDGVLPRLAFRIDSHVARAVLIDAQDSR